MSTPIVPKESGSHCHGWRWNWLGTKQTSSQPGPFCSWGILIIIGKKHHFQWQQLPLSPYPVSPRLPTPRGTPYGPISCVWRPACWSFQTHHLSLQGRGPVQPSFSRRVSEQSVRSVYTAVPTDSFPSKPPVWGEQANLNPPRQGLTDYSKQCFRFQGWMGLERSIIWKSLSSPPNAISWILRKRNMGKRIMARISSPGVRTVRKAPMFKPCWSRQSRHINEDASERPTQVRL